MKPGTKSTVQSTGGDSISLKDFEGIVESIQLGLKQVTESVSQLDNIRQRRVDKKERNEKKPQNELSPELIAKIDWLYTEMDTNGDWRLSKRETMEFFKQYGPFAEKMYEETDGDGNGSISPAEWREYWQQLANNGYSQEKIAKEIQDFETVRRRHTDDVHSVDQSSSLKYNADSMRRAVQLKMLRVHDAWLDHDDDEAALELFRSAFDRLGNTKISITRNSLARSLFGGERDSEGKRSELLADDKLLSWGVCVTMHPHCKLRLAWDFLCTLVVIWDLTLLPVSLLISEMIVSPEVDRDLSLFTACFWTVDILASCKTGYDGGNGIERAPAAVVRNYLKTWFILDLLVVIFEWASFIFEANAVAGGTLRTSRNIRILKFSRAIRIIRLIKLQKFMSKVDEITGSMRLQTVINISKLSFGLFFLVHLLACGWFAVGETDPTGGWVVGGLKNDEADYYKDDETWTKYIASFRWTLAQINGRTDRERRNLQEMLYVSMCAVFAIMFMSFFVGSMTTKLMELQSLLSKEKNYVRVLYTYAEVHKLSWNMVLLCKRYIKDHMSRAQELDAEKQLLALLPPQTVIDLLNEVRLAPVCKHQLFCLMYLHDSSLRSALRDLLSRAACSETARDMEMVCAKGTIGDRMLFVESGDLMYSRHKEFLTWMTTRVLEDEEKQDRFNIDRLKNMCGFWSRKHVYNMSSTPTRQIGPGRYIGEATLWTKTWAMRGDLLSVTHSKLISFSVDKFVEIVKNQGEEVVGFLSFYAQCYNTHLRRLIEQGTESDLIEVNLKTLLGLDTMQAARARFGSEASVEVDKENEEMIDPFGSVPSRDDDVEVYQEPIDGGKKLSSILPHAGKRTANGCDRDCKSSL